MGCEICFCFVLGNVSLTTSSYCDLLGSDVPSPTSPSWMGLNATPRASEDCALALTPASGFIMPHTDVKEKIRS